MAKIKENSRDNYDWVSYSFPYPYGYKEESPHPYDSTYTLQTTYEQIVESLRENMANACYERRKTPEEEAKEFLDMLHPILYQNFDEAFNHEPLSQIILSTIHLEKDDYHITLQDYLDNGLPKTDSEMLMIFYQRSKQLRGIPEPEYKCNYEDPITPVIRELNRREDEMKKRKKKEQIKKLKFWKN